MLLLALLACNPVPGDWSTMFTAVEVDCAPGSEAVAEDDAGASETEGPVDPEFEAMRQRQACLDDPFSAACVGEEELAAAPVVEAEPEVEAEVAPVVELAPVVASAPSGPIPPAVGLASQPAWGVRLLSTLPHAQPPRAALGLPDGSEVVVAPGSMLPEAGIIVVAVGANNAQLAKVTPEGDHAEIETVTLQAQYGQVDPG